MPRIFTLDEANALLPRLSEIVSQMQEKKPALDELRAQLADLVRRAAGNGHLLQSELRTKRDEAQKVAKELNDLLNEINGLGCELKGIEQGLIDFQSEREGRTVYLCWRLGEDEIAYWHELDTGFSGRRPL